MVRTIVFAVRAASYDGRYYAGYPNGDKPQILAGNVIAQAIATGNLTGGTAPLFVTPNVSGIFDFSHGASQNFWVHGGSGANNPPNGTFGLISIQAVPSGTGDFTVNGWNAGAKTGFTPINAATAQLGYAPSGQTTTAQWEGTTIGAYLQSIDRPGDPADSKMMITPEIFYAAQPVFTGSSSVMSGSCQLQIPTATGANTYLNINHRFSGPGGVFMTVNAKVFHLNDNGSGNTVTSSQDLPTSTYIINIPPGAPGSTTYMSSGGTILFTGTPWSGFKTLTYSFSYAQFQAILNFLQTTYGAGVFPSVDPTQYFMVNSHINAEFHFTPVTAEATLGWSMKDWTVTLSH